LEDLNEVFKIITSEDKNGKCNLVLHKGLATKGNRYKLYQKHVNFDLRKYYFVNRIVAQWNSLPDNCVSSTSINMFKNRLEKFLHDQDIYFNWKANLTGTGNRSKSDLNVYFDIC